MFTTTLLAILVAALTVANAEEYTAGAWRVRFHVALLKKEKAYFDIEVYPEWAPIAAGRFRELVESDFFKGNRFFKMDEGFVAQFGLNGKPDRNLEWEGIEDEEPFATQERGCLSFTLAGYNGRKTTMFINLADNHYLNDMRFVAFAKVVEGGMDVVDRLYKGYGEEPEPDLIKEQGNRYLKRNFPKLSYITHTELLEDGSTALNDEL